jgi:sulfoxide reductase catalytic subunit YedY
VRRYTDLRDSDVTPKATYLNRRRFLAAALASPTMAALAAAKLTGVSKSSLSVDEKVTPYEIVTGYNNYYEFGTAKLDPAKNAAKFQTSPWTVTIDGEVTKPKTLDLDAILKLAPIEQRISRHRCVEGWSMVIPWLGFPLSALLKQVEPTSRSEVRRLRERSGPQPNAACDVVSRGHFVSVLGRAAHGRSPASAGDARNRRVR